MNTCRSRRAALRMAFGLAALAASPALLARGQTGAERLIAPPDAPMMFSARLTYFLSDGQQLSVLRQYRSLFTGFENGFMLEGEQVHVEVQAPDRIRRFAEMEERRVIDGLFPLILDPFGRLLAESRMPLDEKTVAEGVAAARDMNAGQDMEAGEKSALNTLFDSVDDATTTTNAALPHMLFCPPSAEQLEVQQMELPDGTVGRVTTRFRGTRDRASGLMTSARREVVSEIGDDQRRVLEQWELAPA